MLTAREDAPQAAGALPLAGIRVIEHTHLIFGPVTGMILADLGADVIKMEPAPSGDSTRQLSGFAAGFFGYFNRNKRSIAINMKDERGRDLARRLAAESDVLIENFAPGTMDRLGCGYSALSKINPRLIYCSLKGFLDGPYEKRVALDEVVQFMGGLAHMTGPSGRPLRAGTSVVDIIGGTMGVIAILAALRERDRTENGQLVKAGLFESVVFMMGQHMAGEAITGEEILPMPERRSAWGIYQPFATADGDRVFVAVTSDKHWVSFCDAFGFPELRDDPRLATNDGRIEANPWLIPELGGRLATLSTRDVLQRCETAEIPFGPLSRVADLALDPHLNATGALLDIQLGKGYLSKLPRLPIAVGQAQLGLRRQVPGLGQHTTEILAGLGLGAEEIAALHRRGIVATGASNE